MNNFVQGLVQAQKRTEERQDKCDHKRQSKSRYKGKQLYGKKQCIDCGKITRIFKDKETFNS